MKKRFFGVLVSLCLMMVLTVIFSIAANAETTGKCGDNITWEISGTTLIISGEGEMYDYEPTPLLPITYVVPWSDERIKFVRFEGSITRIGNHAFDGCVVLESIVFDCKNIKEIGELALHGFSALENVCVDDNNSMYSSLNGVLYSKNKDKLIYYPFKKTETEFIIPNTVKTIGMCAITLCESLNSIVIPDGVETIEDCAFICNAVREFNIPASVKNIGMDVFYEDNPVIEAINVDENNTAYSSVDGVLYNKNKTELVEYPRGRKDSFYAVPEGVEIIIANFFNASLKTIYIPKSVKELGEWTNLFTLEKILYPGTEEEYCKINNYVYAQNMEFNYKESKKITATVNNVYQEGRVLISVNFDKVEKECKMWAAVYDLSGKLVKIFDEDIKIDTENKDITFNAGEEYKGYDVKVMFWEESMTPIINSLCGKIEAGL